MDDPVRSYWLIRLLILAAVIIGLPTVLSVPAFLSEAPIRVGEASPRTVIAPSLIRVEDLDATDRARQEAADAVEPVIEFDPDAQTAVISQVQDYFTIIDEIREPADAEAGDDEGEPEAPPSPSPQEQMEALEDRLPMLDERGRELLATMSDSSLEQVRSETVDIARELARQRIREGELEEVLDERLRTEFAVRDLPSETGPEVVDPFIRAAMRPTVVVDEVATARARRDAAESVSEVVRSFPRGSVIVSAGEQPSVAQVAALDRAGLLGADPRWELLRALGVVAVLLIAIGGYLRTYEPRLWGSNRDVLVLAVLVFGFAILLGAMGAAADRTAIWLLAVPSGALAMLATILFSPPVGVLMAVPATLLVALAVPDAPGVIAFTAAATLISVPLVTRLSARGQLRRASLLATIGYIALAGIFTAAFSGLDDVPLALLAGTLHGLVAAVIVLGGLPFIESGFGIVTATSLIDLADRNHPLLRELEQKAIGSYNHSVTVATLVERACRAIDADPLLGSVCALYHDIGKVQRPYFFIENQVGIRNPHHDLEPRVSARIIHRHVDDGIEMATTYSLPAEVVDGIATHHGTTLVTYFYLEAVRRASPADEVREEEYRYRGRKPRTKETAVLMLADCCEAASRAAAQNDRNLTRDQLVDLVDALIADRVDDGQLDESPLTFNDLKVVKGSFIDTLVGVYHPRITYPGGDGRAAPGEARSAAEAARSVEAAEATGAEGRDRMTTGT